MHLSFPLLILPFKQYLCHFHFISFIHKLFIKQFNWQFLIASTVACERWNLVETCRIVCHGFAPASYKWNVGTEIRKWALSRVDSQKVPPVNFGIRSISFLSPFNSEIVVVQVVVEVADVDAAEWQLNWETKTISKIVAGQCEKLRSLTGLLGTLACIRFTFS